MTRSTTFLPLAGMLVATAVLTIAGLILMVANGHASIEHAEWGFPGFQGAAALVFAAVGAPVAWTRPRNPIGWLFLLAALLSGAQFAGHQYALYGLVTAPGSVPEPWIGTWIEEWVWLPIMASMAVFTFFLFPTGTFLSPRWRVAGGVALVGVVLATAASMFFPLSRVPGAVNPLAQVDAGTVVALTMALGMGLVVPALLVAWLSLVVRFRRSSGVERQQLKWLLLGGLVMAVGMAVYFVITLLTGDPYGAGSAVVAVLLFAGPVSMAVAMLRHGLFEVDRLLSRTVVYAIVSVVLVVAYAGTVLILQPLLHPLTGGDTVAVAASTLFVATAFHPVRRRVQAAVDRRFFRSRYDARLTAERLGARIRSEVDLDRLADALLGEIGHALRPEHAGVWIRRR